MKNNQRIRTIYFVILSILGALSYIFSPYGKPRTSILTHEAKFFYFSNLSTIQKIATIIGILCLSAIFISMIIFIISDFIIRQREVKKFIKNNSLEDKQYKIEFAKKLFSIDEEFFINCSNKIISQYIQRNFLTLSEIKYLFYYINDI